MKALPRIVIDSREQQPYEYDNSIVAALPSGDYSLEGYEHVIAIERKSKEDAYNSLGCDRERFKREIIRLSEYRFAAVIIECSVYAFMKYPPRWRTFKGGWETSKLNPKAALNTLTSWQLKYGIHVNFCCNRDMAQDQVHNYLRLFWENIQKGEIEINDTDNRLEIVQG